MCRPKHPHEEDSMTTLTTPLCRQLGIEVPVVQAPIGSAVTTELVAAVANGGGLGTLALTWGTAEEAVRRIRQVRRMTPRPFAANLVLDFPVDEILDACLAESVPVISTFWGDPSAVAERAHSAGSLHIHTVGSVAEAERAVAAGVDVIVAQGCEAGGHVRGEVTTMALVPAIVDAVHPVPVIAAGGIADGRGLAAALALGAQAGWMGTRFLTASEAATHGVYRQAVIQAAPQDAVYTRCFDGGWPNAPHRCLRNSTLRAWEAADRPAAPNRPGEGAVVARSADGRAWSRYDDMVPAPGMSGDVEALALYAGQSAGLVHDVAPAGRIVADIATDAAALLRRMRTP
ncbi:NAD(P)H-dependent flavin oxidoreductase [Streptomyces sp. NPDC102340]|uniref:NAD(P)H-dependent flavin oxidoreductase n=1 Tax=unclassified Streptomyces TaxID=2593676 RepID=UPI00382C2FB7